MNIQEAVAQALQQANISHAIFAGGLLMCRIMPVIVLSPFLGGEVVPVEVKLGTGLMLTLVLFPAVSDRIGAIPTSALPYIALMLKEIFLGVTLATIISSVFEAARFAGQFADNMAGMNNGQLYVPQVAQQVTVFGSLKLQISIVLFLTLNGHHLVIQGLADSLAIVPLDGFPRFSGGSWAYFDLILRVSGELFVVALSLCAPLMLASFATDIGLGMINRMASNVQVFFMAMSIKPLASAALLFFSIAMLMNRLSDEYVRMLEYLRYALRLLA